ncbi:MAG: hypothetical protein EOO00_01390 [Chitinophagaceae bacterium]|nr:MAG: hypothetical protein EOO00_01390 [Chitinophagaceae bacterium]
MKSLQYIVFLFLGIAVLSSCEKKDYPAGLPEYDHHYYAIFVPNNNTGVSVNRTQTALIKFPVQFYSTFVRSYDAVAKYTIVNPATGAAVLDQDYSIVDRNGAKIQPDGSGLYSIVFPKAVQATDTIYIKLLNSAVTGTRKMEVQIKENKTDEFYVDIFSTAFKRPVEIK